MKKQEEEKGITEDKTLRIENQQETKSKKEQKRTEAETRNKIYKKAKPYRDTISKIESEIKTNENRLKEIEGEMQSESFYKNTESVIKINKEFGGIKQKLNVLYHEWFINSDKLKEIEAEKSG